jgi:hypothetical protein
MLYRTAFLGAARGQVVTCLGIVWLLLACGDGSGWASSRLPSPELTSFVLDPTENLQLMAAVVAGVSGAEVQLELPAGSDVSALVPRIEHTGASIEPASGTPQDFSQPVQYVVTADDGSKTTYTVTVTVLSDFEVLPDTTKAITHFSIAGVEASIGDDAIALSVPHDTRLRNITPEIRWVGAAIAPDPLDPQDFSQPVVYAVMAQDGSARSYTVRVSVTPNHSKAITHFRVFGIDSVIDGDRITLTLPASTDLTSLAPVITLSGGGVTPPSGAAQDFSKPVEYTVTGADGSRATYTVVVRLAAGSSNDIVSFEVPAVDTTLRGDVITLRAPFDTDSCVWAPTIVHTGARIEPPSGTPQDFSMPVVYTVTAGDGTARRYSAQCEIPATSARGISRVEVLGLPASIVGDDITLTLPNAVSLGAIAPTFVHHGVRLTPASGTPQNFFVPVSYTLLEADGTKRVYSMRIMSAARSDNELVALSYQGHHARIEGQQVSLTVPDGTDVTKLAPVLVHRGARVTPLSQFARDFSKPQRYSVVARDNTQREYEVSVRVAAAGDKVLTAFSLLSTPATIEGDAVRLSLPRGTSLRALAPSLEYIGASIEPAPDAPQDFRQPVSYTITAADGSTQSYAVEADIADEHDAQLTGLRILGVEAMFEGGLLALRLPAGTDLRALVPSFRVIGQSLQPLAALPQDFTQPLWYEVTAANGDKRNYQIAVTLLP